MDQSKDHLLSEEVCFCDGKVKRCKGFVSLTASVYHPVLRKLIPLATTECEAENSTSPEGHARGYYWRTKANRRGVWVLR